MSRVYKVQITCGHDIRTWRGNVSFLLLRTSSHYPGDTAGPVPEISVFPTGISVIKRAGNFAIWWTLQPSYRDESGMNSGGPDGIVLHSPRCIFIIISIPFNSRNAALRLAEAMIGAKVINFVFRHVCFVSRIWRQNSSQGSLVFSCFGNRAQKFLIWTQGEVRPGNRASPVNRGLIWRDPEMAYSACRQCL